MYFYSDNTVLTVFVLDHKHDNILELYIASFFFSFRKEEAATERK